MLAEDSRCGIEKYGRTLELNPRRWPAHDQLGLALAYIGRDDDGMRAPSRPGPALLAWVEPRTLPPFMSDP